LNALGTQGMSAGHVHFLKPETQAILNTTLKKKNLPLVYCYVSAHKNISSNEYT